MIYPNGYEHADTGLDARLPKKGGQLPVYPSTIDAMVGHGVR